MSDKHATSGLSWDEICRRASGRRQYNSVRQFRADYRLVKVVELLHQTGFRRGYQTKIAKVLGVSRSTICRDFRRLYYRWRFGREGDKILDSMAAVAKHARDDARADREYELRKIAAARAEVTVPAAEGEHPRPPDDPCIQVPMWLPAPGSSLRGSPGCQVSRPERLV
jgi:hypothetical protein